MPTITVEVTVAVPPQRAWESYTQPEHIVQWNFATSEWCCPTAENDLQPGGKFSWRMEAKDGSMGFDFAGTYDEVRAPEHIAYHLEDNRAVEVRFTQDGGSTRITQSFEVEDENSAEQQRAGWQAILGNFKTHVEQR